MEEEGLSQVVLDTEVQVVQGEFKINNFFAACMVSGTISNQKANFRQCVSGPLFDAQGIPFGVGVVWGVQEDGSPNLAEKTGLILECLAEKPASINLCCRMQMSLINSDVGRSIHKRTSFLRWNSQGRGWSPSYGDGANHIDRTLGNLLDEMNGWLHNGALIIRAKLEFVPKTESQETSSVKVQKGDASLGSSFKALLASGDMADVVITVGEEQLNAHSLILCARSQVFRTMLFSPMKEGLEKEVKISDISADVMKGLLEYLYTGNIQKPLNDDDFSSGLLHAAHRFELKELLQECEQVMSTRINVSTAASWFEMADLLSCQDLRAACLRYIHQNLAVVQGTQGYEELVQRRPALLKDIIAAVTPPVKAAKPPAKRRKK